MEVEISTPVLQSKSATRPTPVKAASSPPSDRVGICLRPKFEVPSLMRSRRCSCANAYENTYHRFTAVVNGSEEKLMKTLSKSQFCALKKTNRRKSIKKPSWEFMSRGGRLFGTCFFDRQ